MQLTLPSLPSPLHLLIPKAIRTRWKPREALRRLSTVRPPPIPLPQMPPLALFFLFFPILATFLALVLAALCMGAGSGSLGLEGMDLYTFNTTRIGLPFLTSSLVTTYLNTSTTQHPNSTTPIYTSPSVYPNASSLSINTTAGRLLADFGNGIKNPSHSLAHYLGMFSFYSVHMQMYCEGYYNPEGTDHRSVSKCAGSRRLFYFLPLQILQAQLAAGASNITLEQLGWGANTTDTTTAASTGSPPVSGGAGAGLATQQGLDALRFYFKAGYVIYIFALTTLTLSFLGSLVRVLDEQRTGSDLNFGYIAPAALVFLTISSTLLTIGSVRSVSVINQYGGWADVNAALGPRWQGATWAAVGVMAVEEGVRGVEWFVERRRVRSVLGGMMAEVREDQGAGEGEGEWGVDGDNRAISNLGAKL